MNTDNHKYSETQDSDSAQLCLPKNSEDAVKNFSKSIKPTKQTTWKITSIMIIHVPNDICLCNSI